MNNVLYVTTAFYQRRVGNMLIKPDWYRIKDTRGHECFGEDIGSGARWPIVPRRRFGLHGGRPVSRVVRSVRRKCRGGTSARQAGSRGKEANRLDQCAPRNRLAAPVLLGVAVFTCQLVESYLRVVSRCATCAMGMMGMFKWFRKDVIQRDRNGWNLTQKQCGLNNESYRNALQAFINRRRISDEIDVEAPSSPDKKRADLLAKNNNLIENEHKSQEPTSIIPGVPHIRPSEIFEIGWVAGTEDRYLELIFAEWQNTRVSLKRHSHPECKTAVRADLDILSEIPHPNVLLLMATTYTDDHGLVSIFESVDCTLYHYIHDQGERISIQAIAKCGGRLSDALRHCHMRGYVHTAISSHCVYLASSGVVKLGGWELAMDLNSRKAEREYEERLRAEIFRWQAPELFQGYEPRKENDVYGLALLIWEMCTMHVPWSGYSKADVERQYVHWKRGVIMDLYDFPPLLNNLLEAGLQLDVNKRTIDMNRMGRFLQRLEMQYEDEDPVYIDQYSNNNNDPGKTYILPTIRSPMPLKNKGVKLTKSVSAKQLAYTAKKSDSPPRQYFYSKKSLSKQSGNLKTTAHIEQMNFFADDVNRGAKDDIQKNMNVLTNVQNNYKKNNSPSCNVVVLETVQNEASNQGECLQPWNSTYRKVKAPYGTEESGTASIYSSPMMESTDDESYKDARTNLKQLKKVLANRREQFFYGSDSSHASAETSPKSKTKILLQARNKDYEPHKPASHKTSLEPKCGKSPNLYDPTYMKSSLQQHRKIPYLHGHERIKNATMQQQVLNTDPQQFFETALWRKEKLICLSKMRKTFDDEFACYLTQQSDENDTVTTEALTKTQTIDSISTCSDGTYVIKRIPKECGAPETVIIQEENTHTSENKEYVTDDAGLQSEPLQVLKDALDRATNIVCTITPNTDDSCPSSFKAYDDFEVMTDDSQTCKSMFENLYDLQMDNDDEDIKTIEKSTTKKDAFAFHKSGFDNTITSEKTENECRNDVSVTGTSLEQTGPSYDITYSRNFVCESIAEVSSEFNSSCTDLKPDKRAGSVNDQTINIENCEQISKAVSDIRSTTEQIDNETEIEITEDEKEPITTNFNFLFLGDISKNKDCNTCHRSALPRRRSLPAALSQLKTINNSALGKLPIRRGEVPDNTVEDIYIDDEFGDDLNVNMVLLDENLTPDEDFLPEMLAM